MTIIIGGGISGLALAWQLQQAGKPYLLLEADSVPGGKIKTIQHNGFLMDTGPNTLLADETVFGFIHSLGLNEEWISPAPVSKQRFIFRNGKFHGLSPNPLRLLTTPLLSWKAKRQIWQERNQPRQQVQNETFASFITRRFGAEILDWVATPVQYGIHAADPGQLLVADAFPTLVRFEQETGSVVRGLMKASRQRQQTINFKSGMATLPLTIANRLKHMRLDCKVRQVQHTGDRWKIAFEKDEEPIWADQVVICTPAYQAAAILSGHPDVEGPLKQVRYNHMAIVHRSVLKAHTNFDFGGFGGLIPPAAGKISAGSIWASSVFPGRAPGEAHLMAQFVGGALQAAAFGMPPDHMLGLLDAESKEIFQFQMSDIQAVTRWEWGIPQYDLQRRDAQQKVDQYKPPGLYFLSNWLGGISVADCIRNAIALEPKLS